MNYSDFKTKLASLADDDYRDFVIKGVPSERPFIGVRVPQIRELVKEIPRECFSEFLNTGPIAFEELLARGMIIARLDYPEMLKYFDSQVKYIDDWCSCDTFCASLRPLIKNHKTEFLDLKIEKLLKSKNEFAVRVGSVCLLDFYVEFDYLFMIFDRVESLANREEYYIKMAIAWLLAECFIKFPDETYGYLRKNNLPKWTLNKTISKICDSRRIDPKIKDKIKLLRQR